MTLKHVKNNSADIVAIGRIVEIAMNYQSSFSTTLHDFSQTFHNLLCLSEILPQETYQIKLKTKSLEQFEQFRLETRYSRKIYTEAIFLLVSLTVIARI